MKTYELKKKFLNFFKRKNHKIIQPASLIPENDPTVLFTTAGMHPLVPFLLGQPHPLGKRLTGCQKCVRTDDIDEVGDNTHLTFFEMIGNWSLGDYFKEESIEMSFEFLTEELKIPKEKIAISCFKGDKDAPRDTESSEIWKSLGISEKKIAFLDKKENWWGPAGETGPCGPDTEIFYWNGNEPVPNEFNPDDDRWVEIWNNVFMEYNKTKDGFKPLKQKNVDTGLGIERVAMILQNKDNVFQIDSIKPIYDKIKKSSENPDEKSLRIITDHMRAAVFILADERGVTPSNVDQGYVLRRFIRRSIRHMRLIESELELTDIADVVIKQYKDNYEILEKNKQRIKDELKKEQKKFKKTLSKGLKEFEKISEKTNHISGKDAFLLFQSFGFPIEMIVELAKEKNKTVDVKDFEKRYKRHQELSRLGAEKKFKGGLADHSEETKKLHTATHLLNQALREVLGSEVKQKGSNITKDRLRFDFNFNRKLTEDEIKKIENLVNEKIKQGLEIKSEKMTLKKALESGAQAEFGTKYPEEVFVYKIGDFSKEICNGPHVENTKKLGKFKIKKEKSSAAGIRRIKAVLE